MNWCYLAGMLLAAGVVGRGGAAEPTGGATAGAAVDLGAGHGSAQTYRAHWLPEGGIGLDGRGNEPAWSKAEVETHFIFPWKPGPAPATEFRALCTTNYLYFTFRAQDEDVVALEKLSGKEDAVFEDRVEVYFSRDEAMKDYFCFEVDSRGRAFDYRGGYYRKLDTKWHFEGLETRGRPVAQGYEVEGRIPLKSLTALGFPELRPGVRIRCGIYRAEFSHDRSGRPVETKRTLHNLGRHLEGPPPIEEWMSWVDPKTREPDFHVPASLGWLEVVP